MARKEVRSHIQKEASSVVQMSRRKPWAMPPAQGEAPPFGGHCGMAAARGRASCIEATRGSHQASTAPSKAADEAWGKAGAPSSVLQRQLWVCGSDREQDLSCLCCGKGLLLEKQCPPTEQKSRPGASQNDKDLLVQHPC